MNEISKNFFFEKKKQKTFANGGRWRVWCQLGRVGWVVAGKEWIPAFAGMTGFGDSKGSMEQKFFAELFFKKATSS